MKKKTLAFFLIIICTFVNAIAQVLLKIGVRNFSFDFYLFITNYTLLAGLVFYGVSSLLFIFALKYGDLSVLMPIFSLTYVWVILLSMYLLQEVVLLKQMFGIMTILIGVSITAKGGIL